MKPVINKYLYKIKKQPQYVVFYYLINGISYKMAMNYTAASILQLCNGKNDYENIIEKIKIKYNEKNDVVKEFVCDFIEKNKKIGVISEDNYVFDFNKVKYFGAEDYWTPDLISIELTHKCPLKCKHCYIDAGEGSFISYDKIIELINECEELGVDSIQLTGGEPLLHPKVFEIISYALDKNIKVVLFTSGVVFSDEIFQKFNNYRGEKKLSIQVSVDGLKNNHDAFRGVDGSFERTVTFIKKMREIGVEVIAATTVHNQSFDELSKIVEFEEKMGVSICRISPITFMGRATKEVANKRNVNIVREYIKELAEKFNSDTFKVLYFESEEESKSHKKNCGLGQTGLKIDPNGDVYPCLMSDVTYDNIYFNTIKEIQMKYSRIWENINSPNIGICKQCSEQKECNGCVAEAARSCDMCSSEFLVNYMKIINKIRKVR